MELVSRVLADFALGLGREELPAAVLSGARLRILDGIGLALAGSTDPTSVRASSLARSWWMPGGKCTVLGGSSGVAAQTAGFVNSVQIHVLDYDDTHLESQVHPTSCIVPAALALGEEYGLRGREVTKLAALGYEIMIRLGIAAGPVSRMHHKGFHTTSIVGTPAVAAMAGSVDGADAAVVCNAIGLATSLASGLLESTGDGSLAKVIQPGWAVQAGMWAATAARAGITGSPAGLEGRFGLFATHDAPLAKNHDIGLDLGSEWRFLATDFKLYPVCHHLQGHVEAALQIRRDARIESAEDVVAVQAELVSDQALIVCEPIEERLSPSSTYSIKFSLPVAVAIALGYGVIDSASLDRARSDPSILALARRVSWTTFDSPDYPRKFPGALSVDIRGGARMSHRFDSAPGLFGRAVEDSEIEAKFLGNARSAIGGGAAAALLEAVRCLDDAEDLSVLAALSVRA
jgi:2-methylcitrate dehydratase PrpD